jgi:hypothetical protein
MSQSDTRNDERSNNQQTSPADVAEHIADIRDRLDTIDSETVADMSDMDLVELRTELKELESETETVRKNVADNELKDRVAPGEKLLGISHIASHNKFIPEDDGSVVARAVSRGIDYTDFVNVNASTTIANEYPDLAEVEEAEYTYLR